MIKFFRRIRQRLLDERNLKKYLIYAIGEILLVMIGILLALQFNNWNESQKDRTNEKKILIDLREEIQTNKQKLIFSINRREKLNQPINRYLELVLEKKINYKEFIKVHKTSFYSGTVNPSFGVINSLISSGSINLIRSDSLKYMLTDWKDNVEDFLDLEEKMFSGHRRFTEFFYDKFPKQENKYHNYNSEELENRYNIIVNDVEYLNRMLLIHNHLNAGVRMGNELTDYIDEMTYLINKELDLMNE